MKLGKVVKDCFPSTCRKLKFRGLWCQTAYVCVCVYACVGVSLSKCVSL
jgi:hypothetical protein